ncbi:MAG: hypothetical protein ACR2IK_10290 [Chloroflexota bacterium]
MTRLTLAEFTRWPEHRCDEAAHDGDPCSAESRGALVLQIARALGHLLRGGHLELDQVTFVFDELVAEIEVRRKSKY